MDRCQLFVWVGFIIAGCSPAQFNELNQESVHTHCLFDETSVHVSGTIVSKLTHIPKNSLIFASPALFTDAEWILKPNFQLQLQGNSFNGVLSPGAYVLSVFSDEVHILESTQVVVIAPDHSQLAVSLGCNFMVQNAVVEME